MRFSTILVMPLLLVILSTHLVDSVDTNSYGRSIRKTRSFVVEDHEFFRLLKEFGSKYTEIRRNHDELRSRRDSFEKESKPMSPTLESYYQLYAGDLLDKYQDTSSPLFEAHKILQDIFQNSSPEKIDRMLREVNFAKMCDTHLSLSQAVSKLLEDLAWGSRLCEEIMRMSLYILTGKDPEDTKDHYARQITRWYNETISIVKPVLSNLPRQLYTCGLPGSYDEAHSIELKVFSKFFVRMCNDHDTPDKLKCAPITQTEECPGTEANTICGISQPCGGELRGCQTLNDSIREVCVSDHLGEHRYSYYTSSARPLKTESTDRDCHKRDLQETEHWNSLDIWFLSFKKEKRTCSSCDCTCEEGEYFINTAPVHSEVSKNRVVTGAKFMLNHNVLELFIQQAELLPNGEIYDETHWIGPKTKMLHKVSWNGARKFLLSPTMIPQNHVLTGLSLHYKMANDTSNQSSYVFLRTHSCGFDYASGDLIPDQVGIGNLQSSLPHMDVDLQDLTSPKTSEMDHEEFIQNDAWITLSTSNGVDGGQSTVPFFDGQEVTSGKLSPLSGAGLYYKGKKGWAGYIGIELYTFNISHFI
ncbi:hypothetical protein QAD02_005816 [Eretmocerus hayati]|uniref:Uncharacterized protein n=1 Tax=Eretmocerus hayati TaxID=131215 RepID=A0ACC2NW77_9HYME|nr:hypothetical protein QAD02_005816 [Eretmocerus hayati]